MDVPVQSVEFYRSILDGLDEGVYVVDRDRRIRYWSRGAERISGYSSEEVVGRSCADNILMHCDAGGHMLCVDGCPLTETLEDGACRKSRLFLKHKNGYRVPVNLRVSPVVENGETVGAVEVFSDASPLVTVVEQARALKDAAFIDPLTGLCNRRATEERLTEAVRYSDDVLARTAVAFIDVDGFKSVNDECGHETGDAFLRIIAETILRSLRSYDFVGRWGGDEFILILGNVDEHGAHEVCERCRVLIERSSLRCDGRQVKATCSIGFTMLRPGDTRESIIRRADEQMYGSKRNGGNRINSESGSSSPHGSLPHKDDTI